MTARERRYIEQIRELETELARKNELIQSYQRQLFEYQLQLVAQESPIPAPRIIMMN